LVTIAGLQAVNNCVHRGTLRVPRGVRTSELSNARAYANSKEQQLALLTNCTNCSASWPASGSELATQSCKLRMLLCFCAQSSMRRLHVVHTLGNTTACTMAAAKRSWHCPTLLANRGTLRKLPRNVAMSRPKMATAATTRYDGPTIAAAPSSGDNVLSCSLTENRLKRFSLSSAVCH
jgi:hypothetical protein